MFTSLKSMPKRGRARYIWTRLSTLVAATIFMVVAGGAAADASTFTSVIGPRLVTCTNSVVCFIPSGPSFTFLNGTLGEKISTVLAILDGVAVVIAFFMMIINLIGMASAGRDGTKRAYRMSGALHSLYTFIGALVVFPFLIWVLPFLLSLFGL